MKYPKELTDRAKREGLHLVTLDIEGRHAKQDSATVQHVLLEQWEVERVWAFFQWLAVGRKHERVARKHDGQLHPPADDADPLAPELGENGGA